MHSEIQVKVEIYSDEAVSFRNATSENWKSSVKGTKENWSKCYFVVLLDFEKRFCQGLFKCGACALKVRMRICSFAFKILFASNIYSNVVNFPTKRLRRNTALKIRMRHKWTWYLFPCRLVLWSAVRQVNNSKVIVVLESSFIVLQYLLNNPHVFRLTNHNIYFNSI